MVMGIEGSCMVRIEDVHTKILEEFEFDIVIVCNGKYSVPYYLKIKGMDVFKGQMIHSQRYRDPEDFRGKRVLVVGGGLSGIDISVEIYAFAEKTCHLCDNKFLLSNGICQMGKVMKFTSDSAVVSRLVNDTEYGFSNFSRQIKFDCNNLKSQDFGPIEPYHIRHLDAVLFFTGYYLSYPFLNADCGLAVKSHKEVGPLYKDLICLNRSTLALVGLFNTVVKFTMFECQAQFLMAFYEGRTSLPCSEEKTELTKYKALKVAHDVDVNKSPFKTSQFQWIYFRDLASIGKFDPPPPYLEALYTEVTQPKADDFLNYKNIDNKTEDDGFYIKSRH